MGNRDQNLVHNLHHQMSKLVRGDFTMNNFNLISPTKRFDVSSSTESLPGFGGISEDSANKNALFVDGENTEDEEDEDDEDEFDEEEDGGTSAGIEDDRDDDDNDISMIDPKKEKLKQENKENVKKTINE